ncbi:MAG: ATP-binding protein [Phycisphaeraceae bacterium]|nr:ATP-binding protein [Phycisphaeraceae bacterium]
MTGAPQPETRAFTESFVIGVGRKEEIRRTLEAVLGEVAARAYDTGACFAIRLALEEALANAIRHGSGNDPSKRVTIECRVDRNEVVISIEDEGPGFDPAAVPDPTTEENLQLPSGRGIMLMRSFMTEIAFSARGNRVRMIYRRPEAG